MAAPAAQVPAAAPPAPGDGAPRPDVAAELARRYNAALVPGREPTAESQENLRTACDPAAPGSRRAAAVGWLHDRGFIAEIAAPAADHAKAQAPPDPPPVLPGLSREEAPALPQVEDGVLGLLIIDPARIADAAEALTENDFSSAERMRLFAKLRALHDRGEAVTPVTIQAEFNASGMATMAARDLVERAMMKPCPAEALPKYFEILRDYAHRRAQWAAAQQLMDGAIRGGSAAQAHERALALLNRVGESAERDLPENLRLKRWPDPVDPVAYRGLAGDFVNLVAPRTEADPVAILAQFLVCFGNVIGRKAHWAVDASRHYCNEFLCVCGLTSRGRKGTSWDITKLVFQDADPEWVGNCLHTGVASGEGLIRTVRDAVYSQMKVGSEMHTCMEDAGVDDKRALWIEDEFQGVLAVMRREGSILSANLRKAWQSGSLENANKNSPMRATGAHVSMVGHITFDELSRSLGLGEIGNGFANRFLWVCSKRSNLLPRGGDLLGKEFQALLAPIAERLREAVAFADDDLFVPIQVGCTDAAWALYDATYARLSRTRLGVVGSVTDRAEAHVRRLAVVYALLDRSPVVDVEHLSAALAFWEYCERSVAFIFGNEDVDPVAEKLLAALTEAGDEGLTQTQILRKVFAGRQTEEVYKALETLVRSCLVRQVEKRTKGRPATIWVACR